MNALAIKEVDDDGVATGHARRFAAEDPRTMPRPRRVLGYARVSSAEQALGHSLRDQQDRIKAYAASCGLKVERLYVEAESAVHEKIERREQIRALLDEVRAGDLIVVDKLDRWSRDIVFTVSSVRDIRARGANWFSVEERLDASLPDGQLMLEMRAVFAAEEHRRIRIRTVGARKVLKAHGMFSEGMVPFGYRRALPKGQKSLTKNVLVVEPREAALVVRMFELCAAGRSLSRIADAMARDGVSYETIARALSNRIYLGEMKGVNGHWIKAQHEAIIDADLYARAEAARGERRMGGARPRSAPSETSTWILRDVAHCALCGRKLASSYAGPKDGKRRWYYRCVYSSDCTREHIKVREVEALAEPMIVDRLTELRDELAKRPANAREPAPIVDHAAKRARLDKQRANLLDAYADDLLTKDDLRARLAKIDAEKLKIDAAEAAAKKSPALASPKARRELLAQVRVLTHAWAHATPEERRAIVGLLVMQAKLRAGAPPIMVWRRAEDLAIDDGKRR